MNKFDISKVPHVLAKVRFKSSSEGGRVSATPKSNYHCLSSIGGVLYDSLLIHQERIAPGQSVEGVEIAFLTMKHICSELEQGMQFSLQDGNKIVAIATVQKVMPSTQA